MMPSFYEKTLNAGDTRKRLFFLSIAIIVIYVLPLFVQGEDTHILIHDNIDSFLIHPKLLIESGTVFASSDSIVPQINMPRIVLGSELNLTVLLTYLLSPLYAYLTLFVITHMTAFMGMYLLLRAHFIQEEGKDYLNIMVALCFGLLPFLPAGGLSVAGQPLVLYSFLNLRARKQSITDWLILLVIPLHSSLVYSFLFLLASVGIIWLYDLVKKRDLNPVFLISIAFMSLIFACVEYKLVLFQLHPFFVSHRYEFGLHHGNNLILRWSLRTGILLFILGQYHAHSLQKLFIGFSFILTLATFTLNGKSRSLLSKQFFILLGVTILISLYYGIWFSWIVFQIKAAIPLVRIFDFSRFHWLLPLLWHLIFALSLLFITKAFARTGKHIVYVLIAGQIFFCFYMSDFALEIRQNEITYKEFFAKEQFREIGEHIGEPKEDYRVISIGMHPSIALFNGFYTADFYLNNYPLEYKHRFRKVIAREIEKDPELERYYDEWGSRLYAFTNDLKRDYFGGRTNIPISHLDYDLKAMRELGIKYVISRVPINSPFIFMRQFSHPDSAWDIYLYKVTP